MKHLVRGFLAVAVMMTALLVTSAPAQAEDCPDPCWLTRTKGDAPYRSGAGEALFFSYGESLHIFDNEADDAGVRVYFSVGGGAWQHRTNSKGNKSQAVFNFDYPENRSFRFFVCISNNGTNIAGTCSPTINGHT